MEITFVKTKWEMWHDPLEEFLERARGDDFPATEIFLKTETHSADRISALHEEYGLDLVGQILTEGDTPRAHIESLEEQFAFAEQCHPMRINVHAGRDRFSFDENRQILERLVELGYERGIPLMAETHRGRATYSLPETRRYLEALPQLRLTADFSHWMVVHESDLSDQPEALDLAMQRSDHIHARVGYEEGPQVPDPRASEWEDHVENHLDIWHQIAEHHRQAGAKQLTIAPEFGPPTYMHTEPFSNEPVADAWELNVYMRDLLERELLGEET